MKHEAVELLSRYLKIDTTNPPGNEDRGVAFFAEILEKEGVAYKTYQAVSRKRLDQCRNTGNRRERGRHFAQPYRCGPCQGRRVEC